MKYTFLLISFLSAQQASAQASDARVMWAAFTCYQLAVMAGQEEAEAAERHFNSGYEAGKRFLIAVQEGVISDEEFRKEVPIGVSLLLSGPTADFVIGRVFEASTNDAHDSVTKRDSIGLPLPIEEWVNDAELQSTIARGKYQRENCFIF